MQWYTTADITGETGQLKRHDTLATYLPTEEKNIWVESKIDSNINAAGVVLSSLLSGFPKDNFTSTPLGNTLIVLETNGDKDTASTYPNISEYRHINLIIGGYDWAIMLHGEDEIILFD